MRGRETAGDAPVLVLYSMIVEGGRLSTLLSVSLRDMKSQREEQTLSIKRRT